MEQSCWSKKSFLVIFTPIIVFCATILLDPFGDLVVVARNLTHGIEFYFDDNDRGDNFCPVHPIGPVFTFCGVKIPNLTALLPPQHKVTKIGSWAMVGVWALYAGTNYNFSDSFVSISANQSGYTLCTSMATFSATKTITDHKKNGGSNGGSFTQNNEEGSSRNPKSMRFLGNPNPSLPGLSLFHEYSQGLEKGHPGPYGEETYVDSLIRNFGSALPVTFWAFTGTQNWTLYSQPNFKGDAVCVGHPQPPNLHTILDPWGWGDLTSTNLTRVGSVHRTCKKDSPLVPKYGDQHQVKNGPGGGERDSTRGMGRDEGPGLMTLLGGRPKLDLDFPRNVALENSRILDGQQRRVLDQCMNSEPVTIVPKFDSASSALGSIKIFNFFTMVNILVSFSFNFYCFLSDIL